MRGKAGIGNRESGIEYGLDESGITTGFSEEESKRIVDHRDLDVWKTSMSLATEIYRLTASFPSEERFGLISQMRRAAVSIPANIAEGYGRETSGSYLQFLRISQGSARELETLIEIAWMLRYLNDTDRNEIITTLTRVAKMLRRLIQAIQRKNGK